ncbi:uncharacterized protein [Rutidosis leptorrhynchoides]|uniref:uncharacterized protein n=1 Tax=Rutidosis leptorrhynchoides TaxID=125765 RepID=UPI003A99F02B
MRLNLNQIISFTLLFQLNINLLLLYLLKKKWLKTNAINLEIQAESGVLDANGHKLWVDSRKQWLEKEAIKTKMLKQKARVRWILDGDENSRFFHALIRRRNSKCNIRGLTINGVWNENPKDIKLAAFNHFTNIFREPEIDRPSLEDLHYPSISNDDANALESPFDENEIHDAIFDCGSTKAQGPDGFNMRFFKKYWDIIKGDLIDAINWFWNNCEFSNGCNASFVILIPKKTDPLGLGDFRPISLIGSYYKIIAKILSNRLRRILPALIGHEQSAFLKNRFILDGALIVNESIDFLKSKKQKGILFKVDFEKAFDCLNWNFLLEVMKSAEGLNILTKAATEKGVFKGVEIGNDKILISHLQYADDTLFLGEWSRENAYSIRNLLICFELASGLKVNFQKSCLYGVGVDYDEVCHVANRIGCQVGKFPFIYLGLPIGSKMNKLQDWNPIVEKIKSRLSDWKMRTMSFGGRVVLIKSILNSLSLYYFSIFRAPPRVLKILESVRRNFFWGGTGSGSKMCWVKWEDVIASYENGGLNFGSLKSKNLALLGKWWWRFKTETNSLWVKVIKSIHGPYGGLRSRRDSFHSSSSGLWYNIFLAGITIEDLNVPFKSAFVKIIGDGSTTSFWQEQWAGNFTLSEKFPRLYRLENVKNCSIQDRIVFSESGTSFTWDWVRQPSGRTGSELLELSTILANFSFNLNNRDSWSWTLDNSGIFKVKSLSAAIDDGMFTSCGSPFGTLRNRLVPKKLEIFVWRAIKKRIPVRCELDKRGIDLHSVRCPLCDDDIETVEHSLIFCKYAMDLWSRVYKWWGLGNFSNFSVNEALQGNNGAATSRLGKKIWQATEWVCAYYLWKNRNNKVFRAKSWPVSVLLNEIQIKAFDWISHRVRGLDLDWLAWLNNPNSYLVSSKSNSLSTM